MRSQDLIELYRRRHDTLLALAEREEGVTVREFAEFAGLTTALSQRLIREAHADGELVRVAEGRPRDVKGRPPYVYRKPPTGSVW